MSLQVDPLASYYDEEEVVVPEVEAQNHNDPLSSYYDEKEQPYKDVVSDELRAQGYEPDASEEFERAAEFGTAEAVRGLLKGASLGITDKIPGLKTGDNIASQGGEIIGSFLPISGLMKIFNNPLTKLAAKSPVLQGQLSSLANLTGSFLSGGTYGAVTEALHKGEMPSTDDFIEHGATWALLDGALQAAGGAARFTKALVSKAEKTKKPEWKIINETIEEMRAEGVDFSNPERVQAKALSILEESPASKAALQESEASVQAKQLKDRKVEQKFFDKLEGETVAEPYLPKEFEAVETVEKVVNEELEASLEALAPRVTTEKQLGENIKAQIDSGLKEAENAYKPAYELAEEAASTKYTTPLNTAKLATDTLKNLEALTTKPEGYKQVIKTLQDALKDAGFVINRDKDGIIEFAVSDKQVSGSQLMELGRRLNKIIRYDSIDKAVQDRLKPVVQAIKQDIKAALKGDKNALEMYETAERDFAKSANKFGKESIRKIRKMDAGEKVAKLIRNPTTLADLKEVVPEGQFKEIERELLEHVRNLNEDKARAFYREVRPHLSQDAQAVGEEILESKIPRAEPSRKESLRNKIKDTVLNDLSKSSLTGERPDAALKLWKTKEGQQIIKESLKDNPNKKEIVDYLTNQSLKDMTSSIVNAEGKINFKKLNDFLKDPATVDNIRLVGGEEGVNFFKNLETLSKRAERNLSVMEGRIDKGSAKDRAELARVLEKKGEGRFGRLKQKEIDKTRDTLLYRMDDYLNSFGIKTKGLLALIGISKFGIPGVLEATAAFHIVRKMLQSKKVQHAIKQAAGPRTDPTYLINAYEMLDNAIED